jgi:hypothetical protein
MFGDPVSVIILFLIFGFVTTTAIISAAYDLRDKNERNFFKSLTSNGWIVLILSGCTLILNWAQGQYSDYKTGKENFRRDSTIRSDYNRSVEKITSNYNSKTVELKKAYDTSTVNIVGALARYGLKYDSARKTIEALVRDSTRNGPDPVFDVVSIELEWEKEREKQYKIMVASKDAGSKNYDVNFSAVLSNEMGGPYEALLNKAKVHIGKSEQFAANDGTGVFLGISSSLDYKLVFFHVKGYYTNTSGNKRFFIDKIYMFTLANKRANEVIGETEEKLKSFFAANE